MPQSMESVTVQFVGSGDAFGSGGRFQACISVRWGERHLLLDMGASSLTAMRQLDLDPTSVDLILLSHLHGDHFGGLPFFILDAQFRRGTKALTIAGPPGTRQRVLEAMEVFFPGSAQVERRFETRFIELPSGRTTALADLTVRGYEVPHPSGGPAYALRVEIGGRVIAYSGDGAWSEALIEVARGADLFICEAYYFERSIKNHLSYATFCQERARLECRRLVLTHMSDDVLSRIGEIDEEVAHDGASFEL